MEFKTRTFNFFRQLFLSAPCEKWLVKRTQNKLPNSFIGKFVPNNYQYKKGSIRKFKTHNDVMLEVDISDYVGHYLYFGFKDDGHDKLFELVNKDDCILDIGTNIGSTILQFAALIGKDGFAYGFEPDPINYANCQRNISLNNFSNLEVSQIGIGDEQGSFDLVVDTESNRGGNRISDDVSGKSTNKIIVERLDDWMQTKPIERVDLIKIDVEGYELKVLKGGEKSILKYKPVFFIELDDDNLTATGDSAKKLVELLEEWNYAITNSITGLPVKSSDNFSNCHVDIIARIN